MTTVEKLFVEIFDRKNRIVQGVKLQTDLYCQNLASKLLIHGITPPPWLWNPNFNSHSSHPRELKKEELISELLLPHPRSAAPYSGSHCSLYNKPVVVGHNGVLSEGLVMDSNKDFNAGDKPTLEPECHNNDIACASKCVPELDISVTSPQGEIEMMISNIYTAPDQSLARIQRSKSRQKALELRKTAKTATKSRLNDENGKIPRIASQQLGLDNELLQLAKSSDIISDNCAVRKAIGECLSKEKNADTYSGRIIRSRSSCNLSSKSLKLDNSSDNSNAVVNQEGKADDVRETELISDGPVEAEAAFSETILDVAGPCLGLEAFVSRTPSDCSLFVKPKALDFNEMEKCSQNEIFSPMLQKERLDKSSEKRCTPVESATSPDKITFDNPCRESLMQLSPQQEVSNKTAEAWRGSFEICVEDCGAVNEELSKSKSNNNLRNDNLEAVQDIQHSPFSHRADVAMEGSESSPKLQGEECEFGCDERNRSVTIPSLSRNQQLGPSSVSSLIKTSTVDQGFLVGEVGMTDQHSAVLDVRLSYVEDKPDLMYLENKFEKGNMSGLASREIALLERKSHLGELDFLTCGSVGSLHREDENFSTSRTKELHLLEKSLMPGRRSRSIIENSWPQFKRRKIQSEQTNFFSASSSFCVKEIRSIGGHNPVSHDREVSNVDKRTNVEKHQNINYHLTQGIMPSPGLQHEQDELGFEEKNQITKNPSTFKQGRLEPFVISSLTKEAAADSQGGFVENARTADTTDIDLDVRMQSDEQNYKNLWHSEINIARENKDDLTHTERILQDAKPHFKENSLFSCCSVVSPHDKHLGSVAAEQTTPEFAGFVIDTEEDGQQHTVGDEFSFNILDFQSSMFEHASVLEQICKSASMHTPLSPLSTTFKLHGTLDLYKSVPNGLLECLDLRSTLNENDNGGKHLRASYCCADEVKCAWQGLSYSDCVPYADDRFGWNLEKPLMSPVGNSWDQISSHSSSSEKQQSSNPDLTCFPIEEDHSISKENVKNLLSLHDCFGWSSEKPPMSPVGRIWDQISSHSSSLKKQQSFNADLTCFPIEEDPSISEENENRDEVANPDTIQEDSCSTLINCDAKREPLAEITEAFVNRPNSVSEAEKFPDRNSLDSINTETSFSGTYSKVKEKLGNCQNNKRSCTNEAKENHTFSVETNNIKKASESLNSRFSKPKLSGKASLRKVGQSLSERKSKRKNIVSNITSFVPLVQQKQAAAVGKGKRDVKVKALEAAEAAKRLQEKKENERKMKKEALKLERARIEHENLRQMELKMKKKEEEQKKKEVDMAARKRLREEEERREKERKRKRVEEARQQQREQEEKLHVGKVEEDVPLGAIVEKVNSRKESNGELGKHQKMEKKRGYDNFVKKPQTEVTEHRAAEFLKSNVSEAVLENCEAFCYCGDIVEPTTALAKTTKNDDLMAKTSREKSYAISPYQCSDDEDDEVDEIPNRKFIPSWASKNSVALVLSSQQNIDPNIIFPPKSFSSMDEVLRPRKLQLK